MGGETEKSISGWTTDTLKQHYDSLREADQVALSAALQAVKEDNEKTAIAFEKRFDSVNEFRGQLSDQASSFLTRVEYQAAHQALIEKIDALTDRMNRNDGKNSGLNAGWAYLLGGVGAVATVIGVILAFNN